MPLYLHILHSNVHILIILIIITILLINTGTPIHVFWSTLFWCCPKGKRVRSWAWISQRFLSYEVFSLPLSPSAYPVHGFGHNSVFLLYNDVYGLDTSHGVFSLDIRIIAVLLCHDDEVYLALEDVVVLFRSW